MEIKPGFYKMRNGKKAEVFVLRESKAYGMDNNSTAWSWHIKNGQLLSDKEATIDLIGPWQEPVCVEWWCNVQPTGMGANFDSKEDAEHYKGKNSDLFGFHWDGTTLTVLSGQPCK